MKLLITILTLSLTACGTINYTHTTRKYDDTGTKIVEEQITEYNRDGYSPQWSEGKTFDGVIDLEYHNL